MKRNPAHPVAVLALTMVICLWAAAAWGFGNLSLKKQDGAAPEPIRGVALMRVDQENLVPGREAEAVLVIGVNPGFHLNSDKPPLDWISPTRLTFEDHPGLKVVRTVFPPAEPGQILLCRRTAAGVRKDGPDPVDHQGFGPAEQGPAALKGTLFYQACDNKVCLPPAQKGFSLDLTIGAAPAPDKGAVREAAPAPKEQKAGEPPPPGTGQGPGARGRKGNPLWLILLTTFLGGLALNLTPCVYPLIPITVAYFGGQARNRVQLAGHGGAYLAGITVTYTTLGTFAALSGRLMGQALQHPLTLLIVAGVLLLLAASMFGFYEFRLPGWLNRLGGAGTGRKGLIGSLVMGLTLGLVAAPCIGPFTLGVLTFVAQKGDPFIGAAVFLALSLGLGLPLAVLGFFSSTLAGVLPSSGAWMEWIRRLLGAVLVFMAVYLLRPLVGQAVWPWALGGASFLGALLALLSGRGVGLAIRLIVAAAFAAVAVYQVGAAVRTDSVRWPAYTPAALERAADQGLPAVLDFTADWCPPCRELAQSLAYPGVRGLTKRAVVLSVDLSDWDSPEEVDLRRRFGIRGVPTLVFIGPDGRERTELRLVGAAPPVVLEKKFRALLGE